MCGIFGTIHQDNTTPKPDQLRKAAAMLQHRGPDGEGYFSEGPLAFAHRRLAIIDLSDKGLQPMEAFGNVITYNGEIYNYLELRQVLQKSGYHFSSQSDTEVVLAAYAHWGQDCVHHFRGMWAFALYDRKRQVVFCSRDRFGIKPFYYTRFGGAFHFSSEIKAFSALSGWSPEWNKTYAAKFLLYGQQHFGNDTLFAHVFQLAPGHQLNYSLADKTFQVSQYYTLDRIEKQSLSREESGGKFRELFDSSIRLHLRSDVRIGTAFSGGLDSSSILANICQLHSDKVKNIEAIAYCNKVKGLDESAYIDIFAQKYPLNIHRISPDFSQLIDHLDEVILAQDEPLLSASLIAQYFVFKAAKKEDLPVMLDGQGADELLAGYGTYYPPLFRYLFRKHPLQIFPQLLGLLRHHRIPQGKIARLWQSNFPINGIDLSPPELPPKDSSFAGYTKDMIRSTHLPGLLHFEDRNSMAHSIEARVPFLDHHLVEFCLSLPPEIHIRKGIRKMVLRDALRDLLPEKIVNRYDKIGFATPQEQWMEKEPQFILKMTKESQLQFPEVFNKDWMPWVARVLSKKHRAHYPLLWRAISLGRWGKLYL